MRRDRLGPRSQQRRFGVLCLLAYVALSWSVRLDMRRGEHTASLFYPLDTFSMYAEFPADDQMGHILIRDEHGKVRPVTDFRSFDCAEPLTGDAAACSDRPRIAYHYDELADYIRHREGPGDVDAQVILRTWQLRPAAPPLQLSDCVIAHCKVSR